MPVSGLLGSHLPTEQLPSLGQGTIYSPASAVFPSSELRERSVLRREPLRSLQSMELRGKLMQDAKAGVDGKR